MKKIWKRITITLGILFFCAVIFFKIEEISEVIVNFKVTVFSLLPQESPLSEVDFSQYTPLCDEENACDNILVAHACWE